MIMLPPAPRASHGGRAPPAGPAEANRTGRDDEEDQQQRPRAREAVLGADREPRRGHLGRGDHGQRRQLRLAAADVDLAELVARARAARRRRPARRRPHLRRRCAAPDHEAPRRVPPPPAPARRRGGSGSSAAPAPRPRRIAAHAAVELERPGEQLAACRRRGRPRSAPPARPRSAVTPLRLAGADQHVAGLLRVAGLDPVDLRELHERVAVHERARVVAGVQRDLLARRRCGGRSRTRAAAA